MKITRASDFAVRVLMKLANTKKNVTSQELSMQIEVPFNHVSKIVQALSRTGYIVARKGKNGGLMLARDPKQIDLAQVMEIIEGPFVLSNCVMNRQVCHFSHNCRMRKCLKLVRREMIKLLQGTSIFDLTCTN